MEHKVISYGRTFTSELLDFVGVDRETYRNAKRVYRHYEHRQEFVTRLVVDKVVVTKHDDRLDFDHIYVFNSRSEYDAWFVSNDPRGNHDIENGNAPFGHQ